ncbi:hypothetical protein L1987_18567 [Smallanthus sonchifolius]|uniref:Uncharacterized protein n=1 Tax=Smallanthus sonchifolius TaxID=185202 RepID=A0ACB9J0E9_9ASTR|nr:hypothetical protein L1987_18567 [Smallanthus sonchifolius]
MPSTSAASSSQSYSNSVGDDMLRLNDCSTSDDASPSTSISNDDVQVADTLVEFHMQSEGVQNHSSNEVGITDHTESGVESFFEVEELDLNQTNLDEDLHADHISHSHNSF